jgi:hypothetical protein
MSIRNTCNLEGKKQIPLKLREQKEVNGVRVSFKGGGLKRTHYM